MNPIPVLGLIDPHDVDGTSASAQSNALTGIIVRIVATSGDIRFLVGASPTATATSNFLSDHDEIAIPCKLGDKVAIYGGVANIASYDI